MKEKKLEKKKIKKTKRKRKKLWVFLMLWIF
jgi:hypothetical protein